MRTESIRVLASRCPTEEDFRVMAERHFVGREVACPECAARPANPCINTRGGNGRGFRVSGSHAERVALAEKQLGEGR